PTAGHAAGAAPLHRHGHRKSASASVPTNRHLRGIGRRARCRGLAHVVLLPPLWGFVFYVQRASLSSISGPRGSSTKRTYRAWVGRAWSGQAALYAPATATGPRCQALGSQGLWARDVR